MASRYEVEVTVISGKNLKNVNWKHGDLRPYAVLWVDPAAKCSTKVDVDNDEDPIWDEKLTIPVGDINDAVLHVDVVHANAEGGVKPLVGSARLPLRDVVDEAGIGGKSIRTLKLKRPSGRPHGKIELKVCIREPARYYPPPAAAPYGTPYGHSHSHGHHEHTRDYNYGYSQPPPPTGNPYSAPPPSGYPYGAPPPSGYPYGAPPPMPAYGGQGPSYTAPGGQKKSKFGMGTGLAVGAAAGVLGGIALAEGAEYLEEKIEDDVAEKVEEDLGFDDYGDY